MSKTFASAEHEEAGWMKTLAATPDALRRLFVSTRLHFLVHVLLITILLLVFRNLHSSGREADYKKEAQSAIDNVVRLFQISEDVSSNKYALMFEGAPLMAENMDVLRNSGIGDADTIRGYLTGVAREVDRVNLAMVDELSALLALPRPRGDKGVFTFRVGSLISDYADNDTYFSFRYEPSSVEPDLRGERRFTRALRSGWCEAQKGEQVLRDALDKQDAKALARGVKEAVETKPVNSGCVDKVFAAIEQRLADAKQPLADLWAPQAKNLQAPYYAQQTSVFHDRLACLWWGQASFFWLFGKWKWIDVLLITMLGVIVEGMTRFGLHVANRTGNRIYDPGETWRTVLKMLYAPVMSLVVIWTLITTNIVQVDISTIKGNSAIVTLAFLFGLFPNVPYTILERVANAIFGRTSIASPAVRGKPEHTRVRSEPTAEGQAPNFEQLRRKVRERATAILKENV